MIGESVPRTEDRELLTGSAEFLDDLKIDGCLHAVFVRSTVAFADVRGIDTSAAARMPGVVAVFVASDLGLAPMGGMGRRGQAVPGRPVLASETVKFVGEPIAVVVAESRAQAVDAAEAVVIDYDVRPAVPDPAASTKFVGVAEPEGAPDVTAGADVVVRGTFQNNRVAPVPMECNGCAALPEGERLTVWASTQIPHRVRDAIAAGLEIDPSLVRAIAPWVGGGFGAKKMHQEYLVVAAAARRLNRPVKWFETRSENMLTLQHGRAQTQQVALAAKRDGTITGLHARVTVDSGAYSGGFFGGNTSRLCLGNYAIPAVNFGSRGVLTTTTPTGAYRGAGRPEATALIERAVDLLADELGMDPVELRRRNLIPRDAFPYRTATGLVYDSGDYERVMDMALEIADYEQLRREQDARRERGDAVQLGIGVIMFVETSGGGREFGSAQVHPDGTVTVLAGTSPQGQGHGTAYAQIASTVLGVSLESVRVIESDTGVVPRGMGTMGSRSLQMAGNAVHRACEEVVDQARRVAARLLEAAPEDVVRFDGGRFGVAGVPARALGWAELAAESELRAELDHGQDGPTCPFGCHVAVVEVDTSTGDVRLVRYIGVDDSGVLVNPMLAEGQIHGGVAQGIGQALFEQVRFDADGNPLTANLASYAIPSAAELPSFEISHTVTPSPLNPLGAKGAGESGTCAAPPAVQNAVVDALSHFGVRHIDMPLTPERVWCAING